MHHVFIIFGVSGSGKTTVAQKLSEHLGIPFFDADDFHPPSNIEKMKSGTPLTDKDRYPWLNTLSGYIGEWNRSKGAVLACSALKEKYREILEGTGNKVRWVFLEGSKQLISERMNAREGHFMPESLLESQFEALEQPSKGLRIPIKKTPEQIVEEIIAHYTNYE